MRKTIKFNIGIEVELVRIRDMKGAVPLDKPYRFVEYHLANRVEIEKTIAQEVMAHVEHNEGVAIISEGGGPLVRIPNTFNVEVK